MNPKIVMALFVASAAMGACAKQRTPHAATPAETRQRHAQVVLDKRFGDACDIDTSAAYFEYDSAELENERNMRAVANCLTGGRLKGRDVTIIGNADRRGPADYNKDLGKSRADEVAAYLERHGVKASRIATKSRGEQLATGTTERGYAYDRRVDIILAD